MESAVVSSTEGVCGSSSASLVPSLPVLAEKYVLLSGVSLEIQELKDDLESMNACLREVTAVSDYHYSEQTKTWMKQVREVAYHAEDCIDTWHHNGQQHHDTNLIKGFLRKIIRPLKKLRAMHGLALEIRELKTRAMKVSERRVRYTIEAGASDRYAHPPPPPPPPPSPEYNDLDRHLPALNIDESRLVGLSEKTKEVMELLEDGNSDSLKVVSIVGFGGLGKTTLAVTVFKSPAVRRIQAQAFIAVSQNYDLRILLVSLLKQLLQVQRDRNSNREDIVVDPLRGIETWSIDQIITRCQNHLREKSVFPEDYEIKRGPLVRRWVAEGFINGRNGSSPEEVAERYLDEFVSRSMVTPTRIASTGIVRCCNVHDMMLEVILSRTIQENFISFAGGPQHSATGHDKIRRLSIRTDVNENDTAQEDPSINFSHCRSLSILGCSKKPSFTIFAQQKLLRVLDLEGCGWLKDEDLKEICKLYMLRYLCLRRTNISKLPKLIGRLKELVTLDVRETSIGVLPKAITGLQNLKHLLGGRYRYYTRMSRVKLFEPHMPALIIPQGMKNMKALQKIAHIDIASDTGALEDIGALYQVTKLCAICLEYEGDKWIPFATSLSKLHNSIRHLSIIHWYNGAMGLEIFLELESPPIFLENLYLWGMLSALPQWISSLNNLVDLSLRENFLGEELVSQLGNLQSLVSLKLYHESFVGTKLCFEQRQFPRLKQFIVDNAPKLDELRFEGGAPNLERLTLAFERTPKMGIFGIETKLPELKEVEFFGETIIHSLVEEVIAAANKHPNKPRVYTTVTVPYGLLVHLQMNTEKIMILIPQNITHLEDEHEDHHVAKEIK
ncbi:hypothetical protein EJB05_53233, partial [Eragrostis curvula]